jgi:tetratricopeptide (TPR) repeat protein/transcriptional regulator with XRE-family HTH domain
VVSRTTFGALLRQYRLAVGLTQEALAERAGLSRRGICDLERGARQAPQPGTLALLVRALALSSAEQARLAATVHVAESAAGGESSIPATPGRPRRQEISHRDRAIGPWKAPPPLVGRAQDLARLQRHLARKGPPVLLLVGEPGIGKSRLLQEAAQHAEGQGWAVLAGGCTRAGGQLPFAPLLQALQGQLAIWSPEQRRQHLRGCAWLIRLLPELAADAVEPLPGWTLTPGQERRLLFEAVRRFLASVAGPAGTLLLLDDLQWAGADALDLLASLVHQPPEAPLRVVGAYRDTEVPPGAALSITITDLAHAGLAARHLLAPLSPEESAQLLDGVLEHLDARWWEGRPALRERTLQRAGGVPFFVVSCAQALQPDMPELSAVPWNVEQSIRQRVASLPAEVSEVLSTAAVLGRVVAPDLLMAAVVLPERNVLSALDVLTQARLLVEERDTYRFAHDVIREIVESDVGIARRRVLHRRVAVALEAAPGEPRIEALAYHYVQSDAHEQAIRYLERAGDRAQAHYAHESAAEYYRELLERLDALGRTPASARVREKLGAVLRTVARYDAALAMLEQAAQLYRAAGDQDQVRRTLAQIGQVHAARGTPHEGIARLQPFLEGSTGTASHGLAQLHVALAQLFYEGGRYRAQREASERAAELACALEADRVLAEAEGWRGLALVNIGRLEEGAQVLEGAARMAEAVGDGDSLCRALIHAGNGYLRQGRPRRSRPYFARALEVVEQLGDPAQITLVLLFQGWIDFCTGEWGAARRWLERAVTLGRQIGSSMASARSLFMFAELCLAEGDEDAATRYVDEGLAMVEGTDSLSLLGWARRILAWRDLGREDAEAARAQVVSILHRPGLDEQEVNALLPVLAETSLVRGDVEQAEAIIVRALARDRSKHDRLDLLVALRTQALILIAQGRQGEATQVLEEALALAGSMPWPYCEGRLLHVYGLLHIRQQQWARARARFEAALVIFRRLGARRDGARTEQILSTLG